MKYPIANLTISNNHAAKETNLRDESKSHLLGGKVPLLVDGGISLQESEDQSITESTQKRTEQHNGLRGEHDERPCPQSQYFLGAESIFECSKFVRSINICLTFGTHLLGEFIQTDSRTCFRDYEEMEELSCSTKDQLNPADPFPDY